MSQQIIAPATSWYCEREVEETKVWPEVCVTRDFFQARLDKFYRETLIDGKYSEQEISLLIAIVGEIGNNCFDHNLGKWQDAAGCWFSWFSFEDSGFITIVADRGQGILNSLKVVKPDLNTESEALKIAFEKRLSGRSPERRGNGLKFVRSIINGNPKRGLLFYSGSAKIELGGEKDFLKMVDLSQVDKKEKTGTFSIIHWKMK